MKTIKELQAEVVKLGEQAKRVSDKVDLEERTKDLPTLRTDIVMNELNSLATYHENLSIRYNKNSKDNLNNSAEWWANQSDAHYEAGQEVRKAITTIIRLNKIWI